MLQQRAKRLTLQRHQIFLADQRSGIDVAAAHHVRDQAGDVIVVRANKAAIAHIDQLALDGRHAAAARDRKQAPERRPVARGMQRAGFVDRHEQQFVLVRHNDVAVQKIAQPAAVQRTGADGGHGGGAEAFQQERQQVLVARLCRVFRGAASDVSQPASARHQADADFHQADIAFHRRDPPGRIHSHLTAAAQRQAANC